MMKANSNQSSSASPRRGILIQLCLAEGAKPQSEVTKISRGDRKGAERILNRILQRAQSRREFLSSANERKLSRKSFLITLHAPSMNANGIILHLR
ncbi:MAG: hypothetical protein A2W93_11520 [Bacteroidetes bacterium GWF2_43_63]|nr:MAG: hypothetical protein A2W94_14395 [Bacteroidetes bacterium GWE2_42_42]OFY54899.1 MAG: hypothetical protein A2W93_11520 [Bacteroidetes bacterium GWF2_43_63]HCB63193.1 hypothetical protein [Bacteroidales bacterium]HCY22202.1 hypothetical protein [Bacteroidales bacterium]